MVARNRHTDITAMPSAFWFGGLVKFGSIPGGGRSAGPFNCCSLGATDIVVVGAT